MLPLQECDCEGLAASGQRARCWIPAEPKLSRIKCKCEDRCEYGSIECIGEQMYRAVRDKKGSVLGFRRWKGLFGIFFAAVLERESIFDMEALLAQLRFFVWNA